MNLPQCPIKASDQEFLLDENLIQKFRKAFGATTSSIPPTIGAVALKGAFEIINGPLQVDWRKLLHVSQSFEYLNPLKVSMRLRAETVLKEIKTRAQMHFLNFEISVFDAESDKIVISSRSTLIVRSS